jgi:N-dimethylarginine dimethylaminohydrolase
MDRRLLINPAWLDLSALRGYQTIPVPEDEPWAANLLRVHRIVCVQASHVRTADMLCKWGLDVRTIDLSEFAKAESVELYLPEPALESALKSCTVSRRPRIAE